MYSLTLTAAERLALDFCGGRYFHGYALSDILTEYMSEFDEWASDEDITFLIAEHSAWAMQDGFQSENYEFACLGSDLRAKFLDFCGAIV